MRLKVLFVKIDPLLAIVGPLKSEIHIQGFTELMYLAFSCVSSCRCFELWDMLYIPCCCLLPSPPSLIGESGKVSDLAWSVWQSMVGGWRSQSCQGYLFALLEAHISLGTTTHCHDMASHQFPGYLWTTRSLRMSDKLPPSWITVRVQLCLVIIFNPAPSFK